MEVDTLKKRDLGMHNQENTSLSQEIKAYQPLIEAIAKLFHPFVEVAVHDLKTERLVLLLHNISKRKVGDKSPLGEFKVRLDQFPDYFEPYYKTNWDGKPLKCTSVTIRDKERKPIGLICFNFDASFFQNIHAQLGKWLSIGEEGENPVEMYGENWQKQLTEQIDSYIQEHQLTLEHLTRQQKKELVQYLYQKGGFNFKKAAPFVAQLLKISRASVYNYMQ
jgi:predicted transcriptional regulator YheO